MRILPRSLSGQIALVMTAALLLASAVNFAFLLAERSRAGLIEASGPPLARYVDMTSEIASAPGPDVTRPMSRNRPILGGRFFVNRESLADRARFTRQPRLEGQLTAELQEAGVSFTDARAASRPIRRSQIDSRGPLAQRLDKKGANTNVAPRGQEIAFSTRLADGRWLNALFFAPAQPRGEILRLGASTFVLFICTLGAALWVANLLSRPLRDITAAAAQVGAGHEPHEVAVRGPIDIQQTLEAFNRMSRRVSQLLGEKDIMLGALGHDLRTPLTSLRIRLETMEPEAERQRAIRTIDETGLLLEAILDLARQGRSSEPLQSIDLRILVQDIVEDYAETGAAVSLAASERAPVACRPIQLTRLLRNLVDNALAYGGVARVSVLKISTGIEILVEDDGPGMSPEALLTATHPFVRGEASRNRGAGGSGLGLALAEAIARTHGGSLTLTNRSPHGLSARVRLPGVA